MKTLSIITINYNNLAGLKNTMQSVLKQTYNGIEYVVIDGGSTDGSATYIEQHGPKLSYWISEKDAGIYNAMNKGIAQVKGDYVLFLNSGDTLIEKYSINEVVNLGLNKDIVYGNLLMVYNNRSVIKEYPNNLTFNHFYYKGHLPHPASFIKRELFKSLGSYREDFKIVSDWDFFVKAICKYNASYKHINCTITAYDTTGISANPEFRDSLLKERAQSLQEHFPLFIEDASRLVDYDKLAKSRHFKIYQSLIKNKALKKLNKFRVLLLNLGK
ncbi:glycosyltransferase family 2 protein [Formosa undariae]|uniref:Glycosyltransferase family 2 protein n=1 Tax=Formosa undariae TaxID=1325436 RepID=A0ABV5F091_9FLAO